MPDVLYGLGEPLLEYIELVGPILDLVRLQQADATSVLRAFVREIVWHVFSPRMKVQRVLIRRVPSWHGQMGHGGRGQLSRLKDRWPIERLVNKGFVERPTLNGQQEEYVLTAIGKKVLDNK